MLGDSSMPEEPRRKRVRKGTRSCWECKRRKIKCIPSPDVSICAGCRERNTPCVRQEYVDDPAAHSADDSALARRVARVESLLETSSGQYHPGPSWGSESSWIPCCEAKGPPVSLCIAVDWFGGAGRGWASSGRKS
ncbi:hypothetical protein P175DRAFT_0234338 [Aspergillus ochraceoroseus IBT 24754]|uniref:Zn(2)-C6 fungal-type domain-containing protein n=1 Tax=Aspergillus ochraceoroseus IBT 24754 TaxID=1392256 RepID=A0A2T5LX13_9EURO|nr:uncharacterized protein P175DRAFT_0234338 [Aspergillus ochraceoroseus IBT 24754]PTU20821.1 hypothetical protein P175DRAFT_0234338 [Aspergillus ochraceoroseus IBT 24754]